MSSTAAIVKRSSSSSVTGDEAGGGDPGDRVPGAVEGREEGEHRRARRGRRPQPERRLGGDRERPLAADEEVGQRVAGDVLDVLAAGPDDVPSAITTSSDRTESRVWPYLTQHRPPAFVPRLPPIEHISKLAGSGG